MYERREDRNPSRYEAHIALSFLIGIATSSLLWRTTYIIPRPVGIILGKKSELYLHICQKVLYDLQLFFSSSVFASDKHNLELSIKLRNVSALLN